MPVLNKLQKVSIPHYTLEQSSRTGNTMFEVREIKGEIRRPDPDFLIPHRKDYYLFIFVKDAKSRHWIDFAPYTLQPNTFYFTVPQQVHLKEEIEPMHGIITCFTDEFLQLENNRMLLQLPIIQNHENGHQLNLTPADVSFVEDILQKMVSEFNDSNHLRNQMLQSYLKVMLIYLSRLYTQQFTENQTVESRALLKKFQHLINEHCSTIHDVAAYAGLLNITPGYLNNMIKAQSGKSAIAHIHERLLVEAKRKLLYTELSVKQLSFELGFEDSAYFNRFFKRLSGGSTPLGYRSHIRKMYS